MKQLTCEMCGSTDLIKQDGVFVCQSCGCKYSIEEAKKMMVEGTVDIQGTVSIDTSKRVQNLLQLARRAKETQNARDGARYYGELTLEWPESWEATFFSVYYTAAQCRIGEIRGAAHSVANCIGTTFSLIEQYESVERRLEAYSEVTEYTVTLCQMFNKALMKRHDEGFARALQRMNVESGLQKLSYEFSVDWMPCVDMLLLLVKQLRKIDGDCVDLAISVCERATKMSYINETSKVIPIFQDATEEMQKKKDEENLKKRQKRIDEYWTKHPEEKIALEQERQSMQDRINDLNVQIAQLSEQEEIRELQQQIDGLTKKRNSLGLFKGKEKKLLQGQIDVVTAQLADAKKRLEEAVDSIKPEIDQAQARINEIDEELTKDR